MTKIWILSDLHLENQAAAPALAPPEADVCVIAGDVTRGLVESMKWAAEVIAPHMPVVYVPGNHEFFGSSIAFEMEMSALLMRAHSRVHMLSDSQVTIDGVRFIGATLWTDYTLHAVGIDDEGVREREVSWAMRAAAGLMPDHAAIAAGAGAGAGAGDDMWRPEHARAAHQVSRSLIETALAQRHDGPTVVVTHHAPSILSVPDRFRGAPMTPAYATDLTGLMQPETGPKLWVHGHIHDFSDYVVGRTRVVCNPRGYGDENPMFDPCFVVEVL